MFGNEIEIFIKDFVRDLEEGTASVFAGAGLSVPAGYVNWSELMSEIAHDLGLNIASETDLVSIAQYHVNENRTRNKLNRKILEEFVEDATETENHRIISRLPFSSIWTTNYDKLLENSFVRGNKVVDVKYSVRQLLTTKPKRDIVIYKMHGDIDHASDTILTKEQYEKYHQTHEPFITALTGELTTKTFLFVGFSFTDPNLDYILSRLNYRFREDKRQHYCFVKRHALGDALNPDRATLEYNNKKQSLIINDLKRYGIKSLIIDSYTEITAILKEIEKRFKKKTIFISGSAETYDPIEKNAALSFVHLLSKRLIEEDYRLINGFGWGIGSSVINGALEAIYSNPMKYSENQLILKPFPQFESGQRKLPELWDEYRRKMIFLSGVSIFLFGNKKSDQGEIEEAGGVLREFKISSTNGNVCIPLAFTGYASKTIYEKIKANPADFYDRPDEILPFLDRLADEKSSPAQKIEHVINMLKQLNRI